MFNYVRNNVFVGKMVAILTFIIVIKAYIDSDNSVYIRFDFFNKKTAGEGEVDPYFSELFKTYKTQRILLDGDNYKQLECTNFVDISHTVEYRQNELFKHRNLEKIPAQNGWGYT